MGPTLCIAHLIETWNHWDLKPSDEVLAQNDSQQGQEGHMTMSWTRLFALPQWITWASTALHASSHSNEISLQKFTGSTSGLQLINALLSTLLSFWLLLKYEKMTCSIMAVGWMGNKASEPHRKFLCVLSQPVVTTLQPVLWGWCTLPNFQNDSFRNELYATLQTPAMHRRDYFDTEFEASKVRMCLHKQVWMNACALHILKGRCKRSTSACTQLVYLFLDVFKPSPFSFPLQRRLTKSLSQC